MAPSYEQKTANIGEIHGTMNLGFKRPAHEGYTCAHAFRIRWHREREDRLLRKTTDVDIKEKSTGKQLEAEQSDGGQSLWGAREVPESGSHAHSEQEEGQAPTSTSGPR